MTRPTLQQPVAYGFRPGQVQLSSAFVGGGSRNALLNQMTAESINRMVIAGPVEATAIGNVLLQALTLGHIASHAELRSIVKASFPVETCRSRAAERWREAHGRFARLSEA